MVSLGSMLPQRRQSMVLLPRNRHRQDTEIHHSIKISQYFCPKDKATALKKQVLLTLSPPQMIYIDMKLKIKTQISSSGGTFGTDGSDGVCIISENLLSVTIKTDDWRSTEESSPGGAVFSRVSTVALRRCLLLRL